MKEVGEVMENEYFNDENGFLNIAKAFVILDIIDHLYDNIKSLTSYRTRQEIYNI